MSALSTLPLGTPEPQSKLVAELMELGQSHLFDNWPAAGEADDEKKQMLAQLTKLNDNYPGGLSAYLRSARTLLSQAVKGENPLAGWSPSVPDDGYDLAPGTDAYKAFEEKGLSEAAGLAFAVPAGGLGERLGFSGVKFALPSEVSTGMSVLEVYVGYMLAIQQVVEKANGGKPCRLPLAIMVSDDTAVGIQKLLDDNGYYGLEPSQVTLLKQEKVAALADGDARIAAKPNASGQSFEVSTKPHGHGDIHFLLHSSGTAQKWVDGGSKWLFFFQDTNTLYFAHFLATLGVSATHGVAVNMVSVPRKAKEAIGAVCKLTHTDGRTMVCNVEYNQLEPLLLSAGFAEGDVNEESSGFSRYPGSINGLMYDLPKYVETLGATGGQIDEFINPKFTDGTRTAFKSPTRLECMMQDYVKTVRPSHKVGWTRYPIEFGYFPCKNDIVSAAKLSAQGIPPGSASSAEMAVYHMHATQLRILGAAAVAPPEPASYRGVGVQRGPAIVFAPSFAPCFTLLAAKLPSPAALRVSVRSTLVVRGADVRIEALELDGALEIDVEDGGVLVVKSLAVANKGWAFVEHDDDAQAAADEVLAVRGYKLVKHETKTIVVKKGETMTIEGSVETLTAAPATAAATTAAIAAAADSPKEDRNSKGGPKLKGGMNLSITTGTTTSSGLTISTGAEIEKSQEVKEVKQGCCTLL